MTKHSRPRTRAAGAVLLVAVMTLAACSNSGSGDGVATANTSTTVEVAVAEPTPAERLSQGAETGDASSGSEGGVIQTEATNADSTSADGSDPATDTATADTTTTGGTGSGEQTSGESTGDGTSENTEASEAQPTESEPADPQPTGTQPTETEPTADQEPASVDEDPEDDPAAAGRFELEIPTDALTNLASGSVTELSEEATGSYTLLWFWTPTTPSSEQEAPLVERFATTFAGSIDVVAVGSGGERSAAEQFHRSTELSVTTLWAPSTDSADHYGVERVPSTLLIDSAGTIIGRWDGLPEEAFRLAERIA